ncbi:Uncharacterised protein [Mycobacteroides abscessus subsp. abscessus]|nr:Uncharacterised protein [Mycobacteroides abscessus subsp. abscessus]
MRNSSTGFAVFASSDSPSTASPRAASASSRS